MELRNPQRSYRPHLWIYPIAMANLLRQNMPKLHQALEKHLSDPVQYKRGSAEPFETTASPLPTDGEESVTDGNVVRYFMSLQQCDGLPPARLDALIVGGVQYRINNVRPDEYGGFTISARRVGIGG